jgi:hypothetical protein
MHVFSQVCSLLLCIVICGCESRNYGSKVFQNFDPTKTLIHLGNNNNLNITLLDEHKSGQIYEGDASILWRYSTHSDVGNVDLLTKNISSHLKKEIKEMGATVGDTYESNGSFSLHYFYYKLNNDQEGSVTIKATKNYKSALFEIQIREAEQAAPCNP